MKQQSENTQEIKGDEAVASGVWPTSSVNDAGTPARSGTSLTQSRSGPVRFEVIDKNGRSWGGFYTAAGAAEWAERNYPDQEQDPDRTGKGWDIQVVGS